MNYRTSEVGYIAGTPFVGATVDMFAGPGGYRGEFLAWDPVRRKAVWSIKENFPVWSGALVTGGDVAFYGTMDRWFKAVDAKSGAVLWQFKAGSGIIGQPISYQGADGQQYVAIMSGVGGWPGADRKRADRPARAQRRAWFRRRDPGPAVLHPGRRRIARFLSSQAGLRSQLDPLEDQAPCRSESQSHLLCSSGL